MSDEIRIQAQPDTIPNRFRFLVDREVWKEHIVVPDAAQAAKGSPLAAKLFEIEGVDRVEFSGRLVLVTKAGEGEWLPLAKQVGAIVREHLQAGETIVVEGFEPDLPAEEKLKIKVQDILDREINPAIAMHGGVITIVDVKEADIFIKMGGGCQGCGSAQMTLNEGVERMIREHIPELGRIVDTTDHSAGTNPYYAPGPA